MRWRFWSLLLLLCTATNVATAQALFRDADLPRGFRALEMPQDLGGLPLAGALVQISRQRGFRYIGHLQDCGLSPEALRPIPGLGAHASVSRQRLRVEAGIGASLLRLFSLELKSDAARQLEIRFENVVDDMVIPLAVLSSARAQASVLRERCGELLAQPNVFWVNNALRADRVVVRLLDSAGAQLRGSADQLGNAVTGLQGNAAAAVSAEGEITNNRPVFIAFRDAPPAELLTGRLGLFSTAIDRGPPQLTYGDEVFVAP